MLVNILKAIFIGERAVDLLIKHPLKPNHPRTPPVSVRLLHKPPNPSFGGIKPPSTAEPVHSMDATTMRPTFCSQPCLSASNYIFCLPTGVVRTPQSVAEKHCFLFRFRFTERLGGSADSNKRLKHTTQRTHLRAVFSDWRREGNWQLRPR